MILKLLMHKLLNLKLVLICSYFVEMALLFQALPICLLPSSNYFSFSGEVPAASDLSNNFLAFLNIFLRKLPE